MKAVAGIADEAVRKALTETLKGADAAVAMLCKSVGVNGSGNDPAGALEAFEKGLAAFAKSVGKSVDKVADDFLETSEGQQLYAAYKAEHPSVRR